MSQTVGDFLVQRLHQWGVRHIFGYSGDGINGVFGAMNRAEGKLQFVQARHEEMAAFMASAYAKFSGKLGVCIATSGPGASHLITGPYEDPPRAHGTLRSGIGYTAPKIMPHDADLDRAAEILNSGKKVAMLVGAGALSATDEIIAVADRLGAGCAKALLGKAALPDDLPWVTGSIGLLGTEPSYRLMTECDTLLMVGSGFPYSEFLPVEGKARGVQIDIDASMLSIRFPMEVGLVGDAQETLRALLPRLDQKPTGDWRKTIEGNVRDWWKTLEHRARQPAKPIN